MDVSDGGIASKTFVKNGGSAYVGSDCVATSMTVSSGGELRVADGGRVRNLVVSKGGDIDFYSGATISGVNLNRLDGHSAFSVSGGETLNLYVGNYFYNYELTMSNTLVDAGAYQYVYSGGVTKGTILKGEEYLQSGAKSVKTRVSDDGVQYVSEGGVASGTILGNEGRQTLYGGKSVKTVVSAGGQQEVYDGGIARGTVVKNDGFQYVYANGSAIATTVSEGGQLSVYSGGLVSSGTILSGGYLYQEAGASTFAVTVKKGARQYVDSGATVYEARVLSGGQLGLNAETKTSSVQLDAGAKLTVAGAGNTVTSLQAGKATLVYDLTSMQAGVDTAMLRATNSSVSPSEYTVQVAKNQTLGTYALSDNLTVKQNTAFALKIGNANLGNVTLGRSVSKNGVTYALAETGDTQKISVTMTAKLGKLLSNTATGGTLKGTKDSDIFVGGAGNDTISGSNGRDVVVYDGSTWGKDVIKKTDGTMTLLFNNATADDIVMSQRGTTMTLTAKNDAAQKITVQGWNNDTHSIVFGQGLQALTDYRTAATPSVTAQNKAVAEVWKKAGLVLRFSSK